MKTWLKWAIGIGATGALTGTGIYLYRLNTTGKKLTSIASGAVHKLAWDGMTFRIDVLMKNPTRTPLRIKQPFVKLMYKATNIGTSQSVDEDVEIPAFGEKKLNPIIVSVPVLGLFSIGGDLFNDLSDPKKEVKLDAITSTYVKTAGGLKPQEKTEVIVLKKATA